MAAILTTHIGELREAARHLWNGYMRSGVTIVESASHPDLNGRDARIECEDVEIEATVATL